MDNDAQESFPRDPFALGVLTAVVYAAGFATVAAWFALLVLDPPGRGPSPRAACSICGTVEAVRELEPAPALQLEGSQAEGAVILLAALGGATAPAMPAARKVYETAVLHDDGFVRVLRDSRAPGWQRGDRVKVIMGRVAPVDAAAAIPARSAGAPDGAPAGRTPSPIPPVARVP